MQLICYLIKLCTVFFLKSGGKLFSGQLLEDELSLKTFKLTDVGRCCNTTEKGQFNNWFRYLEILPFHFQFLKTTTLKSTHAVCMYRHCLQY